MANNSIFDLADKFGYNSPFGNWVKEDFKPKLPICKIKSVRVVAGSTLEFKQQDSAGFAIVQKIQHLIVQVQMEGSVDRVEVTYKNNKQTAKRGLISFVAPFEVPLNGLDVQLEFDIVAYDTQKMPVTQKVVVQMGANGRIREEQGDEDTHTSLHEGDGSCYCNRDLTEQELIKIVKGLRKSEGYKSMKLFTASNCHLPNADKDYKKFTEQLNKTLEKYEINSCLRKIHFLAQVYHETDRFKTLLEYSTEGSYNPYFGRGLMQLTHEINYKMYTAYYNDISGKDDDFVTDYDLIATNLFFAFDSAGWFWKRGKKLKIGKIWSASVNSPKYVKKYKAKYPKKTYKYKYKAESEKKYGTVDFNSIADDDYIDIISYLVNGGANGLIQRRRYLKQLKILMNYDNCKSK